MLSSGIFDSKIINNKAKGERAPNMFAKSRGAFAGMVAPGCKVFDKLVVGEASSLR